MRRKICVVTGTRAEYGLLFWLMKEIQNDTELELQIITTGMHLSPEFGLTYREIESDGFVINEKIEMLLSSDTPTGITKSIGLGVTGFAEALNRLKPDIMVVLGDRYEILAAVQSALIFRIPVAHLHGGESTEGCIDEGIRHAVTKMSHVHFVSTELYKQRIIQMGENKSNVYNYGALGIDNILKLKLLNREGFEKSIGFNLGDTNFLVTYHPVTLEKEGSKQAVQNLLDALNEFPEANIIFTRPNSDMNGRIISQMLDEYQNLNKDRVRVYTSLGQIRYLSAVQHCDMVIGNSSSGIIEVPVFHKPTVNIGNRQKGRLSGQSVIHCSESKDEIVRSIRLAMSREFKETISQSKPIYGSGGAAGKIKEILKSIDLENLIFKKFYDAHIE